MASDRRFNPAVLASIAFVATLAAAAVREPIVERSNVNVDFAHPGRFRDVGDRYVSSDKVRAGYLEALRRHIVERASARLPEGQTLAVTVTEVDMAGGFEPGRSRVGDLRIVRDVYPPRIDLRFTLRQTGGAIVDEGRRELRDIGFLSNASLNRSDPLRYEKKLIDDWLDRDLPVRANVYGGP